MKALSIKQPYANRILTRNKVFELRTWKTTYRGDLLICTSKSPADFLKKWPIIDPNGRHKVLDNDNGIEDFMYFGKALCVVDLYDVCPMHFEEEIKEDDPLPEYIYLWFIRHVRPIIPFDVKGKLGLFDVDEPIVYLKRELIH